MKRCYSVILLLSLSVSSLTAQKTIIDLFKSMPDSIMPYLTHNNRLDMVDFMEAKMKAEVTNILDCKSEMLLLDSTHLTVRMSESLVLDMTLLSTDEVYDSCKQVVRVMKNYFIQEKEVERIPTFYTVKWRPLGILPLYASQTESSLLKRDEDVFIKKPIE